MWPPRYELFLLLAGIALLLGGIVSILWSPNKQYKHNWRSITPIIIPLVLFVVPPILSPNSVQVTGIRPLQKILMILIFLKTILAKLLQSIMRPKILAFQNLKRKSY